MVGTAGRASIRRKKNNNEKLEYSLDQWFPSKEGNLHRGGKIIFYERLTKTCRKTNFKMKKSSKCTVVWRKCREFVIAVRYYSSVVLGSLVYYTVLFLDNFLTRYDS